MREIWPSLFTGGLAWLREPYPADLNPFHVVIHHDEVLAPILRYLRVFDVEGLGAEGEAARAELSAFVADLDASATRFTERREAARERAAARA